MKRRILLFACCLAGLSILLTTIFTSAYLFSDFSQKMRLETIAKARYLQTALNLSGRHYLTLLNPRPADHRISLISADGTITYDNITTATNPENHLNRPEVQTALNCGYGENTRFSATLSKQTYYYALLLTDGTVLRLAKTTDSIFVAALQSFLITLLIGLFVFSAAILIGTRITRKILEPLNNLDLDNPMINANYAELTPLLKRIQQQNVLIATQIQELRQKQIEFSTITQEMREGLLVLSHDAKILSFNNSALRLLGSTHANPLDHNVLELERSQTFQHAIQQALSQTAVETILTIKQRQIQLIASPVVDNTATLGAVVILMDITEREDREKLRREFTANVSHELKTPLTAILGYAEIINNGIARPEDIKHFTGNIYTEAKRMLALVNDILLLANLEEKQHFFTKQSVDLYELAQTSSHHLASLALRHQVQLAVNGQATIIQGIRPVLAEIMINLIENAIKYSPLNSVVTITVEQLATTAILTVSDTGSGIPKDEQERIFERFYRVEKSRSTTIAGTGLGLAIVKHGALLHQAKIELSSQESVGTTIKLYFPINQASITVDT